MLGIGKQVTVNGTTFSFGEFLWEPDKYMSLIAPLFRGKTLIRKPEEGRRGYLSRIFGNLYYNKRLGTDIQPVVRNASTPLNEKADQILSALGIEIVKHNPKWSKVIFKSTGHQCSMDNSQMNALVESFQNSKKFKRKSLNVSFGVELEFLGSNCSDKVSSFCEKMKRLVGKTKFSSPLRYNHNDGTCWVLGTDGSLHSREPHTRGYELTSPILSITNSRDMNKLRKVLDLIKTELDGSTNNSCGTHVHMSFGCEDASRRLCSFFATSYYNNEKTMFDKVVPKRRAGNRAYYCRSVDTGYIWNRFQKLNFNNVELGSKQLHLEFRQLDGTLDFDKITAWVKLQKMFCELTMKGWKDSQSLSEYCYPVMDFNDVVCDQITFGQDNIEALLKMSRTVR